MIAILIGLALAAMFIFGMKNFSDPLDNREIKRGMTKREVTEIMGEPHDVRTPGLLCHEDWSYYNIHRNASVRVCFDGNEHVINTSRTGDPLP